QEAAKVALKNGHTTVHTMIGNGYSDLKHYGLIRNHLQDFPVEFILYPQISDIDKALEVGSPRIGGCLLADGSFGSHTAALTEPYHDRPDSYGVLYRTDLFWKKFISRAHRKNLQIAVHCIGDAAIAQILKFYEEVNQKDPKDLRHEIIHNELASESMLDRMSRISVSAVMQPMFDRLWAGEGCLYQKVLGKERTLHTNRLASVEQRKILLCGGSDWYITAMKALQGIDAAVNLHNPLERISRYNAVRMYTSNAAHLSFDENRLGTLTPGKQADMVCLKEDIFNADNISNIEIKSVIKKGILFQISSN
ncbi:MAG: amidohydrolase family protein, partial [Candidatus Cloacimonetes bacterium]|nr:amidohydrolase family protein [Candidatus Cloacimonadota bacterium]